MARQVCAEMKTRPAYSRIHSFAVASLLALACLGMPAAETPSYPPTKFPDASGWGKNVQRTMRLLATSTAEKRNSVPSLIPFRDGESFLSGLGPSGVLIVEHVVVATK